MHPFASRGAGLDFFQYTMSFCWSLNLSSIPMTALLLPASHAMLKNTSSQWSRAMARDLSRKYSYSSSDFLSSVPRYFLSVAGSLTPWRSSILLGE